MIIAITGHKHGIGKAFAEQLAERGHDIVGISRSDGENIRRIEHTANLIAPCDLFINNAQSMFAQTELLYAVWNRWHTLAHKWIWNISSGMTEEPINSIPDDHDDITMSQYRTQKVALEIASRQLQHKQSWPKISIIRPGAVDTKNDNWEVEIYKDDYMPADKSCAEVIGKSDVNVWVKSVIETFTLHQNIHVSEISLSHTVEKIPI
jgi:hypothetical protein